MPVAQGPSAKALTKNSGFLWSTTMRSESCMTRASACRSSGPRTQLVGLPVEPDDWSMTAPRKGILPPRLRSRIEYFLM